jgi:hypothetical protein
MNAKKQKALPVHERMKALPQPEPTHEEIALTAYYIWEDRGCPEGDGAEFWLEAEERLRGARNILPFEL